MSHHPLVSIVDDDESARRAMANLARSLGWRVQVFDSAEALLLSGAFDDVQCVISDVQMPGMTGVDMQDRLIERGVKLPIIFVSAFATDTLRQRAYANGALCFLTKPVDGAVVARLLDSIGHAA
ncbi:response regulator transcription factor [Pararobbsia alpina]|uniref:response regulator transcription factor n=1 Tax=Pararobbsia alpina TaxID=621374 RepID=UPI0039A6B139